MCRNIVWAVLTWTLLSASLAAAGPRRGDEARAQFRKGMDAISAGRIDVARQAFSEAVARAPEWGLAYLQWGIVEQSVDPGSEVARNCLEVAVELAPKNPRAHYQLAILYERSGRTRDAVEEYRKAIGLRPSMRDARFRLAAVLDGLGQLQAAVDAYQLVIQYQPGHTGALSALADLYEKSSRMQEAEHALLAIARAQPRVAYHHYRLGQFYDRIGEMRKARKAYSRANSLDPRPQRKMRRLR